ncbi:MAG: GGDEF domain-containing protein [Myxococcaceae bacterium]|nr:GGDEF domain-containing protein [Myxococcaceae bacterium]
MEGRKATLRQKLARTTTTLEVGPEREVDPLAQRLAKVAAHLTGADLVCVVLRDDGDLFLAASHGARSVKSVDRWTALCASNEAPLVVSDVKAHGSTAVCATGEWRWVRRWMGLSLRSPAGKLEGVVHVFGEAPRATTAAEQDAVLELAGLLFAQLEMRGMVRYLAIASHAARREKERALEAQRLTESILKASPGQTYLFDVGTREVSDLSARSAPRTFAQRLAEVHLEDRELVQRHYASLDSLADGRVVELSYRTETAGQVTWVLSREVVFRRDAEGRPSQLLGVTNDVTSLVEVHESLQALARTDELTQLANPRHLRERLAQLVAEAGRGRRFALLLADIDHFKRLNDTFGHPVGDRVLASVARTLKVAVRQVDFVARSGGEEFTVLLVDVDEAEAQRLAERLRAAVQAAAHEQPATISVGGACFSSAHTADSLVHHADVALYRAKQDGRNRVAWAAPA